MEKVLTDVKHIPNLKRNLISLNMLNEIGYANKLKNSLLKVLQGSMVIMKGLKQNGFYILDGEVVTSLAKKGSGEEYKLMKLWQMRLGHVSDRGL